MERKYPHAFDFMADAWDFLLMMFWLFVLYFYFVSPQVDKVIAGGGKEQFDFGTWMKDLGKKIWDVPQQLFGAISKAAGKKD